MEYTNKICIVGGGAAGMMAAGVALEYGADVTVFEHTDRLGKKLAITGKGRCNVTNVASLQEFMDNVPTNPRFLYSALSSFSSADTMELFERLGVVLRLSAAVAFSPRVTRQRILLMHSENIRPVRELYMLTLKTSDAMPRATSRYVPIRNIALTRLSLQREENPILLQAQMGRDTGLRQGSDIR